MFGFFFGFLCLFGIAKVLRGGRGGHCGGASYGQCGQRQWGHRHGHWGHGHWGHGGHNDHGRQDFADSRGQMGGESRDERGSSPWASGAQGLDFFVRRLFRTLDTTPGQEKVIRGAIEEVRAELTQAKDIAEHGKKAILETVRSGTFEPEAIGSMFADQDEHLRRVRTTFFGALAKISESLDNSQREEFARILERWLGTAEGRFFRGAGPYRA